jgi:hypothetical protein
MGGAGSGGTRPRRTLAEECTCIVTESTKGIFKGATITIKRDGRLRWANWNTVGYGAKPAIGNHSAARVSRYHVTASDIV